MFVWIMEMRKYDCPDGEKQRGGGQFFFLKIFIENAYRMMKHVCMVDNVRGCYIFRALVLQCQMETCEDGPNDMCFRFIFFLNKQRQKLLTLTSWKSVSIIFVRT